MTTLKFEAQYVDINIGDEERLDVLTVWTSSNRNTRTGLRYYPMKWKNMESQAESNTFTIEVPLQDPENPKPLRQDDGLWVEVINTAPNGHEGRYCRRRAGSGLLSYKDLSLSRTHYEVDLLETQYVTEQHPEGFPRGKIQLKLLNPEELKKIELQGPSKYDNLPENKKFISENLSEWVKSSMSMNLMPSSSELDRINLPVWKGNVDLVGDLYAYNFDKVKPDENCFKNLADIAFKDNNVSREWFIQNSKECLKTPKTPSVSTAFICSLIASTACGYAWFVSYMEDKTYTVKSKKLYGGKSIEEGIENFSFMQLLQTGDCEDGAKMNYETIIQIMKGREELKDPKNYWTKDGGWNDPVLQLMQEILVKYYIPVMVLSSVTSAKVEKEKEAERIEIGSQRDLELPLGAHMYAMLVPSELFKNLLLKGAKYTGGNNYNLNDGIIPLHGAPVLVMEGTGRIDNKLLPPKEYVKDEEQRKNIEKMQEQNLRARKILINEKSPWGIGSVTAIPQYTTDKQETRLNLFYGSTVHWYSRIPYERWGVNALKFEAVSDPSSRLDKNPTIGFNIRNIVINDKVQKTELDLKRTENISLIPVGVFDETQMKVAKSLMRHLPVYMSNVLHEGYAEKLNNTPWENTWLVGDNGPSKDKPPTTEDIIKNFQKLADEYTKGRLEKEKVENITKVTVYFMNNDFLTGYFTPEKNHPLILLRQKLLEYIKQTPSIIKTSVSLITIVGDPDIPYGNNVYGIRVEVYISTAEELEKEPAKKTKNKLIDNEICCANIDFSTFNHGTSNIVSFFSIELRPKRSKEDVILLGLLLKTAESINNDIAYEQRSKKIKKHMSATFLFFYLASFTKKEFKKELLNKIPKIIFFPYKKEFFVEDEKGKIKLNQTEVDKQFKNLKNEEIEKILKSHVSKHYTCPESRYKDIVEIIRGITLNSEEFEIDVLLKPGILKKQEKKGGLYKKHYIYDYGNSAHMHVFIIDEIFGFSTTILPQLKPEPQQQPKLLPQKPKPESKQSPKPKETRPYHRETKPKGPSEYQTIPKLEEEEEKMRKNK